MNCTSLTTIYIPKNVTSIGTLAFDGCSNLVTIDCTSHKKNSISDAPWGAPDTTTVLWKSVSANVAMTWDDSSDKYGYRPDSVTLTVYDTSSGKQKVSDVEVTPDANGAWAVTVEDLPDSYLIEAANLPNYTAKVVQDGENWTITFTVQYAPPSGVDVSGASFGATLLVLCCLLLCIRAFFEIHYTRKKVN